MTTLERDPAAPAAGAPSPLPTAPGIDGIRAARERLRGAILETPTIPSARLSRAAGGPSFLKLECLQVTGSFKIRGAYNRCTHLDAGERERGVICASAGNHGQGLACSAQKLGIPATVVVPENAPYTKVRAIRGYGARVVLHGDSFDHAAERAREICRDEGLVFVHAYDDPLVVAGQGTIGLEMVEALPALGTVVVPIGGGGLIAGIAIAVKALRPDARIVGVVSSAARGALESFRRGEVVMVKPEPTIADGIRVKQPGGITFPVLREKVDDVVEVTDDEIGDAIFALLESHKALAEGAGAAAVAAVLAGKVAASNAGPLCAVVCGGNIDLNLLQHVVERGLTLAGTYLTLTTRVPDRPGQLTRLLSHLAQQGFNILEVEHRRAGIRHALGVVEIEVTAEARDPEKTQAALAELRAAGYEVRLG